MEGVDFCFHGIIPFVSGQTDFGSLTSDMLRRSQSVSSHVQIVLLQVRMAELPQRVQRVHLNIRGIIHKWLCLLLRWLLETTLLFIENDISATHVSSTDDTL